MNSKKPIFALLLSILVVFSCLSAPIARSGISPAWIDYISLRPAALLNNDEDEDEDDEEDDDEYYDPRLHIPDSVLASWPVDSLAAYADSLLSLNPIDSIRIDEALIPSEVADSIQAVVDSVYRQIFIKDSTARAKAEFQRWFDSIPKKEQKKWILENVTIPKQRRKADSLFRKNHLDFCDALVLPGGLKGAETITANTVLRLALQQQYIQGSIIAAICAAPMALAAAGILKGKHATIYPGMQHYLEGAIYHSNAYVVEHDNIITGCGPAATHLFASAIAKRLVKEPANVDNVIRSMCYEGMPGNIVANLKF